MDLLTLNQCKSLKTTDNFASLIGRSQDSTYSYVFVVNEIVVNDQLSTCGFKLRINIYENCTVIT